MSNVGTPLDGKSPSMLVDTSVVDGSTVFIKRGDVLYYTGNLKVAPVDGTNRGRVAGIAGEDWPKKTRTIGLSNVDESVDQGYDAWLADGSVYKDEKIAVHQEGIHPVNITIPANGTDVTVNFGDDLVAGSQAALGSCKPLSKLGDFGTPNEAEIRAGLDEERLVFGHAVGSLGLGIKSNDKLVDEPGALGENVPSGGTLVKDASVPVYATVYVKLKI